MKVLKNFFDWSSRSLFCAVVVGAFFAHDASAQGDAAARFPQVAQVAADYPDAAQAYVVLNLLWDALHEKSLSADAVAKRGAYYNASQAIQQKQMMAGDKVAGDFQERTRLLRADRNFRLSVLAKYHLADVPVEAAPQARRDTTVTDSMVKGAVLKASPFLLGSLIAMILIVHGMVRNTTDSPTVNGAKFPDDGLPGLPESLRVVEVPGLEYTVGVLSGLVLDKETSVKTTFQTTTTSGQVYSVGDQFFTTPARSTTTSTSTQTDLMWIRTPDRQETSWTFTGGSFKARPGHLISAIARVVAGDGMEFLTAYNHTTKQFVALGAGPHGTRRGRWAWLVSALAGAVGFAIALAIILSIQPSERTAVDKMLYPVALFLEGLFVSVILGFPMVLRAKNKIFRRRNERFAREYLGGFEQFLQQRTPALEKHYASMPGA